VSDESRIGTQLAGYRIESLLGRGGMGVVYLAEHLQLRRKVALKVLAPELGQDPRFRERFLREWELAASLEHPNIVPIYDAGEAGGVLYLAMRLVDGQDLKSLIQREGPLDPSRVSDIVEQVASALDRAHSRGLVHRDVKSANILLSRDAESGAEHAYLADFGLTKQRHSTTGVTRTGQFLGSVDYASPEQLEGRPLDGRCDVYSLGCVAFECLAGRPPFGADSEVAVMMAHLREAPPRITDSRPELQEPTDGVLARAMAKVPAERPENAGAFAQSLRQALSGPMRTPVPLVRHRRRTLALAAGGLIVAVALLAGWLATREGATNERPGPPSGGPVVSGAVVRINPDTNRVVAGIPSKGAVVVGGGFVWVITEPRGDSVDKINAENNQVVGTIEAGKVVDGLAFGEGSLWATAIRISDLRPEEGNTFLKHSILRIDPATNRVTEAAQLRIEEPAIAAFHWQGRLAVGEGAIWMAIHTQSTLGKVVRIDLDTDEQKVIGLPAPADGVTIGPGAIWVRSNQLDPTIFKLDPATGTVVDRVSVGNADGFAASNSALWVADSTNDVIIAVDASTVRQAGLVASPAFEQPFAVAVWADAVWVLNRGNCTVVRIDPVTEQVVATIDPNTLDLAFAAAGDEGVWVGGLRGFGTQFCE
jgi:serine/threonine-protein kinase